MRKKIAVLAGIMVMLIAGMLFVFAPANAKTIEEARSECEAKNGQFKVNQVYSDGSFSSSCSAESPTNTKLPTKDTKTTEEETKDDENDSDTPTSGPGMTGNSDNSEAQQDNGCNGDGVKTNLFGGGCVSGEDSVFIVLNVILQVLTWGVGIAGTIGIVITGIQYMTAKDDVAQLTKAKNRLIQIVIGLVAYAVMWAFLQWLLPGGVFGN